jgi:CRISPR-associated protein (TIGR03984 family)
MAAVGAVSTLFARSVAGIGLEGALAAVDGAFSLNGAIAMLYSPERFVFGLVEGGRVRGDDGDELRAAGVFEARIFTSDVELRWLADPTGGHAAVLSEQPDQQLDARWTVRQLDPVIGTLPVRYLLWGWPLSDGGGLAEGWCRLGEARVGAISVPHAAPAGRLALAGTEYLGVDAEHGNARVMAERLLRIEPASVEEA